MSTVVDVGGSKGSSDVTATEVERAQVAQVSQVAAGDLLVCRSALERVNILLRLLFEDTSSVTQWHL